MKNYPIEEQLLDAFDFLVDCGRSEEALEMVRPLIGENPNGKSIRELVMEANADTQMFCLAEANMAELFDWVPVNWCYQGVPIDKKSGNLIWNGEEEVEQ